MNGSPALPRRLERLSAGCLLAALWLAGFAPRRASAHELEIDQLRLWVEPEGALRGQLLVAPELTRRKDESLPDDEARARVQAFATANVTIDVNGEPCALQANTRELYVLGGAALADVVMLRCVPATPVQELRLALGDRFVQVSVEVVGFRPSDLPEEDVPKARLMPGGSSWWFTRRSLGAPGPSAERTGRPGALGSPRGVVGTIVQFVRLGAEHILPGGLDHVLFVVGLTLNQRRLRRLFWELLTFTLAHTLTLFFAALGWLLVSPRIVEPLIALSIVVVALLGFKAPADAQASRRARLGLCLGFGLVHGLGFAGALDALGLGGQNLVPALLGFNVGVELGQLFVAACTVAVLALLRRDPQAPDPAPWLSLAVAASGLALLVSRLF